MLFRNAALFPEVGKSIAFPNTDEAVVFTCDSFSTEGGAMILIPDESKGLEDPPSAHPELTRKLGVPVINLGLAKYASLIRGTTSFELVGVQVGKLDDFSLCHLNLLIFHLE